jgi:hypothetical protein
MIALPVTFCGSVSSVTLPANGRGASIGMLRPPLVY